MLIKACETFLMDASDEETRHSGVSFSSSDNSSAVLRALQHFPDERIKDGAFMMFPLEVLCVEGFRPDGR